MKLPSSVVASLMIATFSGAVEAGSITLAFNSLPSAQGMSSEILSLTGATETDVFSVDGQRLVIDTVGNKTLAQYRWENSINLDQPLSLRVAIRLDELVPDVNPSVWPRDVFRFLVGAGHRYYGFAYSYHGFDVPAELYVDTESASEALVPGVDVFSLHEYLIEADPVSGAFNFSVDGVMIRSGYGRPVDPNYLPDLNIFVMGGIGHSCDICELGSRVSVYGLQVSQVPEPSISLLLLAAMGAAGVVAALRKERQPLQLA